MLCHGTMAKKSPILLMHSIRASSSSGSTCNILPGKGLPSYLIKQNFPINLVSRCVTGVQISGGADLFCFFWLCRFAHSVLQDIPKEFFVSSAVKVKSFTS